MESGKTHLLWIVPVIATGFLASFLFADLLALPADIYYLIYFALVLLLFHVYASKTALDLKIRLSRRFRWGLSVGLLFSVIMVRHVFTLEETPRLHGPLLLWSLFWRGIVYGFIDGVLLSSLPWLIAWRAIGAEKKSFGVKIGAALLSLLFILLTTTAYHLGYSDFRSPKIVQANIGNALMSIPTLLSANPVASPITHAATHVAAVLHAPQTELFLPPHREEDRKMDENGFKGYFRNGSCEQCTAAVPAAQEKTQSSRAHCGRDTRGTNSFRRARGTLF